VKYVTSSETTIEKIMIAR